MRKIYTLFLFFLPCLSAMAQSKKPPCRGGDYYDYKGRKIENKNSVVKAVSPKPTMIDIWNAYQVELPCYFSGCDTMAIPVIIIDSLGRAFHRYDITSYFLSGFDGQEITFTPKDSAFPSGMVLVGYKEGRGYLSEVGAEFYIKNENPCFCCE